MEPSAAEKGRGRRQNPRMARLVEIQTTGVISGSQAEGDELDSFERRDVQGVAAGGSVRVVNQGQDRLGHEREASRARGCVVAAKGTEGNEEKRRRGGQGDGQEAAGRAG